MNRHPLPGKCLVLFLWCCKTKWWWWCCWIWAKMVFWINGETWPRCGQGRDSTFGRSLLADCRSGRRLKCSWKSYPPIRWSYLVEAQFLCYLRSCCHLDRLLFTGDLDRLLFTEDAGKQNPEESVVNAVIPTNGWQHHYLKEE